MYLPRIELKTEKPSLIRSKKQTIDLLVRITPPLPDNVAAVRPKLNIGIALDRSGSMDGEKMSEAREAAKFCVDQLLESDTISAVIFDDEVDVLITNQRVSDREMLKRSIDRIEARNSTALHQGWVRAGLEVSEALDPKAINRVFLITDGQANVGETRIDELVRQAGEAASRSVSTTTIGIGRDFNEDLLMPMAEAGQGNAWHVQEPADMSRIFETELNGLVRQIGHSVRLTVQTVDGVRVTETLNDLEKDGDGWVLPNLLGGSVLDIVVRLEITKAAASEGEKATFQLEYIDQSNQQRTVVRERFSAAAVSHAEWDRLPSEASVTEASRLLMNARARREAMEHLDAGDHVGSAKLLMSVLASTKVAAARAPSAALSAEIQELDELGVLFSRNQDPKSARKMAAYQRERTRKSR